MGYQGIWMVTPEVRELIKTKLRKISVFCLETLLLSQSMEILDIASKDSENLAHPSIF